jgi:hypothetical protein
MTSTVYLCVFILISCWIKYELSSLPVWTLLLHGFAQVKSCLNELNLSNRSVAYVASNYTWHSNVLHVWLKTVGDESKKRELIKKKQWQIRQAKAHVISVLGEFARTCQSKQVFNIITFWMFVKCWIMLVPIFCYWNIIEIRGYSGLKFFQINLEARVGFSSDIARVLIEEAKSISADYLLLRGSRNRSNRWENQISNQRISFMLW